jgi:hypothetical protein
MQPLAVKGRSEGDACLGDCVLLFGGREFVVLLDMGNQSLADDFVELGVVLESAVGVTVLFDAFEKFVLGFVSHESAVTFDADECRKAILLSKVVFVVGSRFAA